MKKNNALLKNDIVVHSSSQVIGEELEVTLEISVFQKNVGVASKEIVVRDGVSVVKTSEDPVITAGNGVAITKVSFPIGSREKRKDLRVCLSGQSEEVTHSIVIPAKQVARDKTETLVVFKYQTDDGDLSFKFRVLDTDGIGVNEKKVAIFFKGHNFHVLTDHEGEALFPDPNASYPVKISLEEGEELSAIFSVSGIRDKVRMMLRRAKSLNQAKAFTKDWWLKVNNGRAFMSFIITFLILLITLISGADALVQEGIFSGPDGLTISQSYHNEIMSDYGYLDQIINPVKSSVGFPWWTVSVVLFISSIFYMIVSAREEIAETMDDIKVKMLEKNIVKTNDPFMERLVATSSSLGIINNKKKDNSQSFSSTQGSGSEDKPFLGSAMMSYLSLDLVTDFIRGLIRRIFK